MEDVIMQQIVNIIAKDENRREEEVYQDMCEAIDCAYNHEDASIREQWRKIPHAQDKPTPQEVIAYFADNLQVHTDVRNFQK